MIHMFAIEGEIRACVHFFFFFVPSYISGGAPFAVGEFFAYVTEFLIQ